MKFKFEFYFINKWKSKFEFYFINKRKSKFEFYKWKSKFEFYKWKSKFNFMICFDLIILSKLLKITFYKRSQLTFSIKIFYIIELKNKLFRFLLK
jgi:hypothetical protein